jgi:hypothetical protein
VPYFTLAVLLSACSGTSGAPSAPGPASTPAPSPTPVATPAATPTATPTPTMAPSPSAATERVAAQAELSAIQPLLLNDQLEGVQEQAASIARRPLARHVPHAAGGTCDHGAEYTSTTSGNTTNFVLELFYDSACTMPWQVIDGQETTASSGSDLTATDAVTGTNGMAVAYDTVSGSLTVLSDSQYSLSLSASTGPTMTDATGQLGADCTITLASDGSDMQACSFGALEPLTDVPGFNAAGAVLDENSTETTDTSGNATNDGSASGTFYEGKKPPMALVNDGTSVTITGATLHQPLTEAIKLLETSAPIPNGTFTLTDTSENELVTVKLSGSTLAGMVENPASKAVEATFTTDVNGYGTMTYGDGTSATISAFAIQG